MADREGNVLAPPSTGAKVEVVPVEIVASYKRLLQKGVTLATGQGVLPAGMAVEPDRGNAKLFSAAAFANASSVVGFLRDAVDTTVSHEANVVFAGVLKARTLTFSDYVGAARAVADAVVVDDDTEVTSDLAVFTSEDVGRTISGTNIPTGATIASINSGTSVEISVNAVVPNYRLVTDGVLNETTTVTSATAVFTASDVGLPISGTGIPLGATIATRVSATEITISEAATATANGVTVTINTETKTGVTINIGSDNNRGLSTVSLEALATALGGKYLAVQDYFKF